MELPLALLLSDADSGNKGCAKKRRSREISGPQYVTSSDDMRKMPCRFSSQTGGSKGGANCSSIASTGEPDNPDDTHLTASLSVT